MAVANVPSSLLSAEENDLLFTLVGARKQVKLALCRETSLFLSLGGKNLHQSTVLL